ncbi:MAG TPA: hypothetical protein VG538_05740 [Vicinamibacterales bacterium]|jgi:hypothetical protein|nr:hypothetical protein [Vicinamibacterales bacterium]
MYRLSQEQTRSLVRQPESGMGYQVVDAATTDNKTKRGIVYNAELLTLDEDRHGDRVIMLTKSASEALRTAESAIGRIKSLTVVRDSRTTVLSKREAKASGGASEAETEKTKEGEKFYRFSAFENDRRITADNGLEPGTYATTEEDGNKVKTGKEAVERYALPNEEPASYRFTIKPLKDTNIKKGIVQPANGHQGGGVEVIFTDGTTKNTVAKPPTKLPDE